MKMGIVRLIASTSNASVASLHFLGNQGLVINGDIAGEVDSSFSVRNELVVLNRLEEYLLAASIDGEMVEIHLVSANFSKNLNSVSSYSFLWRGGFVGSALYYWVTSDGLWLREITSASEGPQVISKSPPQHVASDEGRIVLFDGREVRHFCVSVNPLRHSQTWVYAVDLDVSFVSLRGDVVAMFGRDGRFSFLRVGGETISNGAAIGPSGACLAANFLSDKQVRTFWSSGWIVDYYVDSHEGLKLDLQHSFCFRAAISDDGCRVAVWDGVQVLEYAVES